MKQFNTETQSSAAKQSSSGRRRAVAIASVLVLSSMLLSSCGSGSPASSNTPVPTPTPTPTPTPDPNIPPEGSGCGKPYPPAISRINVHVQYKFKDYWIVDSSPLVGSTALYCASIGFTDGRLYCTLRQEGAPDRAACELWRAGMSKDTPPRQGPTWTLTTKDGVVHYCTGPESGCEHDAEAGPWKVRAYTGGLYTVCVVNDVCNSTDVDRNL